MDSIILELDNTISEEFIFSNQELVCIFVGAVAHHEKFGIGEVIELQPSIGSNFFILRISFPKRLWPAEYMSSRIWSSGFIKFELFHNGSHESFQSIQVVLEGIRQLELEKRRLAAIEAQRLLDEESERQRVAREALEREREKRRQEEEAERLRVQAIKEEEERARLEHERIRTELIYKIQKILREDYLSVDNYYAEVCSDYIEISEFEEMKCDFVSEWISIYYSQLSVDKIPRLDHEQTLAIATTSGNIQVVARAGSGKTSTMVHRGLFLIKHCLVDPDHILMLAFNRKAARELQRRMLSLLHGDAEGEIKTEIKSRLSNAKKITKRELESAESTAIEAVAKKLNIRLPHIMTFHSLAYSFVHPEENLLYDDEESGALTLGRVVQKIIDEYMQQPLFVRKMSQVMSEYFKTDWDKIMFGGYNLSKNEFINMRRSLKDQTLSGEYVKSYGEKVIANFLFEHNIPFRYERNHFWSGMNYRPDFTLFKTDKSGLIIEYFGLQGDPDYDDMSGRKREYWSQKTGWKLIELYPEDIARNEEQRDFPKLKNLLELNGFECNRMSDEELWLKIKERAVDGFTGAITNFIGRCRKAGLSHENMVDKIALHHATSIIESLFLDLALEVYSAYLYHLKMSKETDFDGLLLSSIDIIKSGSHIFNKQGRRGIIESLRFVCIDEFQDFSDQFYEIIKQFIEFNKNISLFCVGDDWQAINGFAGSDLKYFIDFDKYFCQTRTLYISTNYRSVPEIVSLGNTLMHGRGVPATSSKKSSGEILIGNLSKFVPTIFEQKEHSGDIFTPAVLRLLQAHISEGYEIVLLSRTNAIKWYISAESKKLDSYLLHIRSFFDKSLRNKITTSTAHKYKGLEKRMVIITDAISGSYPLVNPQWVFFRIFGDSIDKIVQEERRLFYVAITRAIDKLLFMTDESPASDFLKSILEKHDIKKIDWNKFPPLLSDVRAIEVRIGNQPGKGSVPTRSIIDHLKACGYRWQTTGWNAWVKCFTLDNFTVDQIQNEIWSKSADGIEVRIYNDRAELLSIFKIDIGIWTVIKNEIPTINKGVVISENVQNLDDASISTDQDAVLPQSEEEVILDMT